MFRFLLGVAVGAGLAVTAQQLYSSMIKKEPEGEKQDEEVTGLELEEEMKEEKQEKSDQETQWEEEMNMMDDEDEWFDAEEEFEEFQEFEEFESDFKIFLDDLRNLLDDDELYNEIFEQ